MCTVSFIPKQRGFYLAMNRDEKRSRETALAPAIVDLATGRARSIRHRTDSSGRRTGGLATCRAIFPREHEGGTWIAANDSGVCLALINWHRIEREPEHSIVSRGQVIIALAGKSSADEIAATLADLPLRQLRPFRLITIIPSTKDIMEWRWNLERLSIRTHAWQPQHWFSSGFDERQAQRERRRICDAAHKQITARKLGWLRRLHRSHSPKSGPFSICMHRSGAATVSYTEVAVSDQRATMRYKDGPPCSARPTITKILPLQRCGRGPDPGRPASPMPATAL